jgi:hypothetical protein
MSFWDGFIGSINTRRGDELTRNRKIEDDNRALEEKIALKMLDDDDPEIQEHGLSILQQSMTPSKTKKGYGGFMRGELEGRPNGGIRSLLDLARSITGKDRPGQLQELPPEEGAAALPPSSPTQGGSPSMLQKAVQGGVQFGAPAPAGAAAGGATAPDFGGAGAATASEVPGQASFGGIDFANPGMGNPSAQTPAVNIAKIAGRVSQDKGQPQPGERARLFFPSAARLAGQATRARAKGEYEVIAEQLQALGATPNETKRAIMSKAGASGGQANVTQAGYAKLADGRTVQTFTYEEAGMAPRLVMAGPDGGFMPVPPDAQATRMGATAGGSQTSRMSVKQAFEYGIIDEEDVAALGGMNQFVSVKQVGDAISVLPATRPSEPFGFQRGSGPFSPGVDRAGNPVDLPQPTLNPKVAAAKALTAAYRSIPSNMRMTQGQRTRAMQGLMQQYPALAGLTPAQIESLAQADDYLPSGQSEGLIQSGAKPQSMAAPPGSDPNILPPDWADRLAAEILKQQGRTMTAPPRPQ